MALLYEHWSFDPFVVLAVLVALVHERGLRRLNEGAPPDRARLRRRRAGLFYLGLAVLLVAVCSPIDYWSDSYLWVHMIQHLLLIAAAPVPIAASGPWLPLAHGVPVRLRRKLARSLALGSWSGPLRGAGRLALNPWVAVAGLNLAVLSWHLPGPFELAEENQLVHVWLMHGSFFCFGLLFFLQLVDSHPLRRRLSPPGQMAAIFFTACSFWVLAMALGLFSKGSWYPWYQAHEGPMLTPLADQQIAAGIMWTCGDFWAIPLMVRSVRRLIEQRGETRVEEAFAVAPAERLLGRPPTGRVHAERALQQEAIEATLQEQLAVAPGVRRDDDRGREGSAPR